MFPASPPSNSTRRCCARLVASFGSCCPRLGKGIQLWHGSCALFAYVVFAARTNHNISCNLAHDARLSLEEDAPAVAPAKGTQPFT